ncbi:hypothetical protein MRX96_042773 [Rhipicephalus microplus]
MAWPAVSHPVRLESALREGRSECYNEEDRSQDEVEEFMYGDILEANEGDLELCGSSRSDLSAVIRQKRPIVLKRNNGFTCDIG